MTSTGPLARRLGTGDAVVIGLGSMIGAGVFAAFGPAARAAGSGLLIGLALAAGVAYCNAVASAQLAAEYPTSGGTYVYGRERLGEWWGFLAGWGFVIGKTASCAAMALTFASYAVPGFGLVAAASSRSSPSSCSPAPICGASRERPGLHACSSALSLARPARRRRGDRDRRRRRLAAAAAACRRFHGGVYGILQSAGLLFFAFAGYARIATLGEEVREPERTIPRAIPIALGITVVLYVLVGVAALAGAGPARLAASSAPIATAVKAAGVGLGRAGRSGRRGGRESRRAARV